MAKIEIQPLTERFSEEEIEELATALESAGAPRMPQTPEVGEMIVAEDIDDDVLDDLLDRLEDVDAACEIYLPIEFEGRVLVGDTQVGSTVQLIEALDELKDELGVDEDDSDDEEDEDDDLPEDDAPAILATKLRGLWKILHTAATEALERHLPLHVVS